MPDRDQLYQALRNADAAGDVEGAKKIASYIQTIGSAPVIAPAAPDSEGAAQGKRIIADAKQASGENGRVTEGLGETALNAISGIGSSIVGGWRGLATLAAGGSAEDAAKVSRQTQQDYTYQPRTGVGKLGSEVMSLPLNIAKTAVKSIGGDIGQYVNGAQGRVAGEAIGDVLPDVGATLLGARSISNLGKPHAADLPIGDRVEPNMGPAPEAPPEPAAPAGQVPPDANAAPSVEPVDFDSRIHRIPSHADSGILPESEQESRSGVLQRIGMDRARQSAIAGDQMTGAVQSQMAKFNEPAGLAAKELFDGERAALQNHTENIVADTGGSLGMDESTLNSRGQVIAAPFDGLRQYFDSAIKNLYKQADEQSGGKPLTNLENLEALINTESNFAGKSANGSLGSGIKAYLREQGIMDKDGNLLPVTPMQAEGIKQYINSQWSTDTSGLAGKIKSTIDDDVFKGAGGDIYAAARNMYKMQKATLDNPNGVSRLMDFDPQTPINRTTPFEKIPGTLTKLPVAQFGHVIDVLNKIIDPQYETPPLLQMQALDALNEIRSHMANSLLDVGSKFATKWNARGISQELQNNSAKYPMVFSPQELARISDLHDAGHILDVNGSYPGAAAQLANARKQGLMTHLIGTTATALGGAGGSMFGPIGAAIGAGAGKAVGGSFAERAGEAAALKRFNQGIVDINGRPPYSNTPAEDTLNDQLNALKNQSASDILHESLEAARNVGIISGAANQQPRR